MKRLSAILSTMAAALAVLTTGAGVYRGNTGASGCARCHEIQADYDSWHASSHRNIGCGECHGGALQWNNLRRVYEHARGELPEQIRLREADVQAMTERCRGCHRQEFAAWQAGPHGSDYARIFLDRKHNSKEPLMDDCLRCHGMYFAGGIRDLVAPLDIRGPWRLLPAELARRTVMPCLACHQVHRPGEPLGKNTSEINRPSLALYDRRSQSHVPVARLPLPVIQEGTRAVRMSPDQRQALCYECHAPEASMQAGSGDDRTGRGIHEGISCLACHLQHGQKTRASCATCHPRLSNCGLEVEKMDTTFANPSSRHNIHWAKCADCHPKGVPKKRLAGQEAAGG